LFFRLLPKLDVVGSSPIARSAEIVGSDTSECPDLYGSVHFFRRTVRGPVGALIPADNSLRWAALSAAMSALRSIGEGCSATRVGCYLRPIWGCGGGQRRRAADSGRNTNSATAPRRARWRAALLSTATLLPTGRQTWLTGVRPKTWSFPHLQKRTP